MGPNAADVVQGFAVAIKCGLTKRQLEETVAVRPSSAQVSFGWSPIFLTIWRAASMNSETLPWVALIIISCHLLDPRQLWLKDNLRYQHIQLLEFVFKGGSRSILIGWVWIRFSVSWVSPLNKSTKALVAHSVCDVLGHGTWSGGLIVSLRYKAWNGELIGGRGFHWNQMCEGTLLILSNNQVLWNWLIRLLLIMYIFMYEWQVFL